MPEPIPSIPLEKPIEKTKAELFAENPDKYVSTDDIICAVGRSDKGMTMFMQPRSRGELVQAFGELQLAVVYETIRYNDVVNQARKEAHRNNGGIVNFARKTFGGRK